MSNLQQIGDLKKKKTESIFDTSSKQIEEESSEIKITLPPEENFAQKKKEPDPKENMLKMMDGANTFDNLESGMELNVFTSSLPMAMQGLSTNALKTYYQIQKGRMDSSASEYLNTERREWVGKFRDSLYRTSGIKITDDPNDEYQNMTFSEVVKELRGHWNIKPGKEYTAFKDAVLDFEAYSKGEDFDIAQYTSKYHNTLDFIDKYVTTHEGAKSPWGKKRLRMAKSIRAKMQKNMEPDHFFIGKFEELGAIELQKSQNGIKTLHKAPDFIKMSREAGNIGASASKIIGGEMSSTDLTQKVDGEYKYKPIVGAVLNSANIEDSPLIAQNIRKMYGEVYKKSVDVNGDEGISPDLFAKSMVLSIISQKISDGRNFLTNTEKIKSDIQKKKVETDAVDTIKKHQASYDRDLVKLNLMNESLAQFFYMSQGENYIGSKEGADYRELLAAYNKHVRQGRLGNLNMDGDENMVKNTMVNFILDYANIKGKNQAIVVTMEDANNMVDTAMNMYKKLRNTARL